MKQSRLNRLMMIRNRTGLVYLIKPTYPSILIISFSHFTPRLSRFISHCHLNSLPRTSTRLFYRFTVTQLPPRLHNQLQPPSLRLLKRSIVPKPLQSLKSLTCPVLQTARNNLRSVPATRFSHLISTYKTHYNLTRADAV